VSRRPDTFSASKTSPVAFLRTFVDNLPSRTFGGKMLVSSIGWILVASGVITSGGGLAAFFSPHLLLRLGFGVENPASSTVFFVRHWGVLIFVVGGLIAYSAYAPATRTPVLIAAAIEKFAIGLVVFFGPMRRTNAMTAIAILDGIFAILYVVYLAGL
jgi:hypothetical protein